jgi:predicted restriction endonuclease
MNNNEYLKRLEGKYLVSGPAPLGRILNYIKRIKHNQYKSSIRGPRLKDPENLDDWTVCFMVGLGLIEKPRVHPKLKIQLTNNGEEIYRLIKNLPNFTDRLGKSKPDMLIIKQYLRNYRPDLYQSLKEVFLVSDSLKNLAIFFKNNSVRRINKQQFYEEYGKIFNIYGAGFNRLPSIIQIAEFCDILIENGTNIQIYDWDYINKFTILKTDEIFKNIIEEDIKKGRPKKQKLDIDEQNILLDLSDKILPEKKKIIVTLIKRNIKLAGKLKLLYQGKCQICNFTFEKKNGENYSEIHHIVPLGEKGSDEIKNIIVLCANCHRLIHYDKAIWKGYGENIRYIETNGQLKEVKYKPGHFKALKEIDLS